MDVQQDVQALLKGKTRCLAQIIEISRTFLDSAESSPTSIIELTTDFDRNRSDAFQVLELIDQKIQAILPATTELSKYPSPAQSEILEHRQLGLVLREIDTKIFQILEGARQGLAREVSEQSRLKDKLSKFKSQWIPDQGEGLDQTL